MDDLLGSQGSQGSADGRDSFFFGGRGSDGDGEDRSGSDHDDAEDALLRVASTVEYADDHRHSMLERIADKVDNSAAVAPATASPQGRSLRSASEREKRAQAGAQGSTTPPAAAAAAVSPLVGGPVHSHTTRRVAASPASLLRNAASTVVGQSPQLAPYARGAASPVPTAAGGGQAQRSKAGWLRAAMAAVEAAHIPPQRSPAIGFGYGLAVQASAAAIAAVASPAPSVASAAPTAAPADAAATSDMDMSMASPPLPAGLGEEAAPTAAPNAAATISAFPPPFESPVIDMATAEPAPFSSRPLAPIAAPSSQLFDSSQPRASQSAASRASAQGRARVSARDMIASQSAGLLVVQPSAAVSATASVAAPRSHSHSHRSSSEHDKHHHHHHHHHRSRSEKDKSGAGAAGADAAAGGGKERRHHSHHHKRAHSASSGDDQAGVEGEKERKHKKHKKHKKDRKDRERSAGGGALAPVTNALVKQEGSPAPLTRGSAAATAAALRASAGSSAAHPLFPDDDEDAMWGPPAPALQRAVQSAKSNAAKTASKKNVKRVELSFKDVQRQKQKSVLSKALTQETTADERAKEEEEGVQGDIQQFESEPFVPLAGGAAGAGRARLALSTPPRRQRLSAQLGGVYGEEEDDIEEYDAHGLRRGSGGFSSGEKRGRGGKKSDLENRLAAALNVEISSRRRAHNLRLSHHASLVPTVGGTQQAAFLEPGCLYVRVLASQFHLNLRFCLVSLCGPDIEVEHTLVASHSMLSPVPVLPKEVAEVCRAVAKAHHTECASVPAGLLRVLILPPSDHVDDGGGGGSIQRIDNFPECFLRVRSPFTYHRALMGISTLLSVRDFSRLLGDEVPRVKAMEQREWEAEMRRTTHEEEMIRSEEAQLRALEARVTHQADADAHDQRAQAQAEDGSQDGGALMMDVLAPLVAPRKLVPDAFDAVPRLLDVSEREWPVELLHFHPTLPGDQLHDLLQSKHSARQPLITLQPWQEPSDLLFGGVIQKTTWRSVNIVPNDEQRTQMEAYEVAARSELPLPSFYVQDASGGVVEVEVPLALLPRWGAVLFHGLGGWVQLLGLRTSTRVSASRMHGEPPSSMQRSFHALLRPGAVVEKRPWIVLTVTEESAFRLNMPSVGAPLSPHVCTSTINVTPLLRLAQVSSVGAARRLNRVTIVGRMMHLINHALQQWKLYLTDESLRADPESTAPILTSSMLVHVEQSFHHEILDSVAFVGADCCFKLVDVAVSFDKQLNVPVLTADQFTDLVKIVSSGDEQHDRSEEKQLLVRHRTTKAIRKLNLYTKQWLMIPQHFHHPLQTHSVHDVTINRLLQGGRVLTPLMQRHSIFALLANIVSCPVKPAVYPCCNWCSTLLGTTDTPSALQRVPTVCHHCKRSCELSNVETRFWLHYVTVLVHVPAFDELGGDGRAGGGDDAPAPSPSRLFPLQLEASELQDLTKSTNEEVKGRAFRSVNEFQNLLGGRSLQFATICSPLAHQSNGVDIRSAGAPSQVSFQVTTRMSQPSDDLISDSSQGFASQSYSSQAEWSSQTDETVECPVD